MEYRARIFLTICNTIWIKCWKSFIQIREQNFPNSINYFTFFIIFSYTNEIWYTRKFYIRHSFSVAKRFTNRNEKREKFCVKNDVSSLCRSILHWLVMKNVHLLTQMINGPTRLAAPVIYSRVIHCFHGCINIHCSRSQTKRWKINREVLLFSIERKTRNWYWNHCC